MNEAIVSGWVLILLLIGSGFFAGCYGATVGIGGAVVLLPILLLLFPHATPQTITSVTMGVVFINALSGTVSYAKQKRIDYRNGVWFACATIPGTVFGILVLRFIPQRIFFIIFGMMMLVFSAIIFFRPNAKQSSLTSGIDNSMHNDFSRMRYSYSCNRRLGVILSFIVGFISGLLGIGGGIIHVPVMLYILLIPSHIAVATSQFMLVFTGFVGTLTHALSGVYTQNWEIILCLIIGVIPGAYVGARLSSKMKGQGLMRLLSLGLVLAGIRLGVMGLLAQ